MSTLTGKMHMQGKTGGRVGVRHVSESTLRGTHHAGWDS